MTFIRDGTFIWHRRVHIYSKFGLILFTTKDLGFFQQTHEENTKWKIPKTTIVNELAPNLE